MDNIWFVSLCCFEADMSKQQTSYTPPTFHTHFNRIFCAVNMFLAVLFKEKYLLYTNNAQD